MKYLFFTIFLLLPCAMNAQRNANYEESKVPQYTLPDILAGTTSRVEWEIKRKPEIRSLFESEMYGKTDLEGLVTKFEIIQENKSTLDGKATMKEIRCTLSKNNEKCSFDLLIFLPKSKEKVPVFLGLNFYGNHTISKEKSISLSPNWVPNKESFHILDNKANEASRGVRAYRWPLENIIDRGYGLANIYCGDLDPDFDDGFKNGIHKIMGETSMATIGAWALGLIKAMDYFETDKDIDATKIAVIGHSRLGKAALWASAQDSRFALTISNESGCGGAALSRRAYGETVKIINTSFPHWFCPKFKSYNDNEGNLPIDQHQLLSLIAPRALYVASAEGDQWSDPRGEYLSLFHTNEVYKLYGEWDLPLTSPKTNLALQKGVRAYHIRSGKHEVDPLDWKYFLSFADSQFK